MGTNHPAPLRLATLAAPSVVSLLRLVLAFHGLRLGLDSDGASPLPAVLCIATSAVLDLVDGWLARALGAASTFGAVVDVTVDAAMWGCLYYLALVVAEPRGRVFYVLLMALEWATSAAIVARIVSGWRVQKKGSGKKTAHWKDATFGASATVNGESRCGPSDGAGGAGAGAGVGAGEAGGMGEREDMSVGLAESVARRYVSNGMKNPLAALGPKIYLKLQQRHHYCLYLLQVALF